MKEALIMKRAHRTPNTSHYLIISIGLLTSLILLASLQGCWYLKGPNPPIPTPNGTPTPAPEPTKTEQAVTYFALGEKLHVVGKTVDVAESIDEQAQYALEALCEGPNENDTAQGYSTLIPVGTRVNSVTVTDKIATVDLTRDFESGGGSLSMLLRVAQVVWTTTSIEGIEKVAFKLDGSAVDAIGGEGIVVAPAVGRADFDEQVAAIVLESPLSGEAVRSPLTIEGNANVFEAQFMVEVLDAKGEVLASQSAMATSGSGTRGTFSEQILLPAPYEGLATIVLFEPSAKDGSRTNEVRTQITVQK